MDSCVECHTLYDEKKLIPVERVQFRPSAYGLILRDMLFYYRCEPLTFTLADDDQVDDGDVEQPRWIPVDGLTPDDFQAHGAITMDLLKQIGAVRNVIQ